MSDVVVLGTAESSTWAIANALQVRLGAVTLVLEDRIPPWLKLWRRARRLGVTEALGQLLFRVLAVPHLQRRGAHRATAIAAEHGLDSTPPARSLKVPSVNHESTRQLLTELRPRVVVLSGTRILGPATLGCVPATFINLHAGITPTYRGCHGGYWALVERRPDLIGTTVHRVDQGIDTGEVLAQRFFRPGPEDNFTTYPLLHLAAGVPALLEVVEKLLHGEPLPAVVPPESRSVLRHHPTLWGYWRAGVP